MSCERFELQIALYVEDDLPAVEARVVEDHLAGCAACRTFAAELRQSQRALRGLADASPGEAAYTELRARVMERVERRRRWFLAWWLAPAAVTAMLLLALVPDRQPPPPLPVPIAAIPAPVLTAAARPVRRIARIPSRPQPLFMKLVSDDPNIIIYWMVD